MRRFFVGLLVFIATLSFVLAVMSNFVRRQFLDTQTFVTTTTQIAETPAVKSEVNKQVTDAVFAQPQVQEALNQGIQELLPAPLLRFEDSIKGAAQQGVSALIGFVLDSQAFQKVLSEALTVMHQKLISGDGLSFNVGDAKSLTGLDQAGGVVGQAASLIPNDIAGVALLNEEQTRQLNTAIQILEKAWVWFALLSLITTIGAIALSQQRRKTIRTWGLLVVIFSLVLLAIPAFLQGPLLASLPDNVRPIVQTVWDVYVPRLDARLWLVFALGLIVFVVAAIWGRLGLAESIRNAWSSTSDKIRELRAEHAEKVGLAAEGGEVEKVGFRERTKVFVETLDVPGRLGAAAANVEPNIQVYRGVGVAVAAVLLLFWPSPTTGVFFFIVALLILYLGGLELIMGIGRKPEQGEIVEPAELGAPASVKAPALAAAGGAGSTALAVSETTDTVAEPELPKLDISYAERISLLKDLGELKASGVLDDAEFAAEKERVMSQ